MLGCLEVVEYSLKEWFNMKHLHQVSLSAFARCIWCVPIILLSIWYNTRYHICVCLQDVIGVCLSYCCLSGTTCVLVVVQYTAVYPTQRVYTCHSPICHYIIVTVEKKKWQGPHYLRNTPFFFPLCCKLLYWKNQATTNSLALCIQRCAE